MVCVHCGKRLVAVFEGSRTELRCLWCDGVDPLRTDAKKWADSSLAASSSGSPLNELARSNPSEVMSRYCLRKTSAQPKSVS
jgi:hypothetical protein